MNLIRNSGFELGTIGFWTLETAGTLEASALLPKYGVYCGKYTADDSGDKYIINNDYIEVSPYSLIGVLLWAKSTSTEDVRTCLYLYDSDYSYIGLALGYTREMDSTWMQIESQIPVPAGVRYIRAGLRIRAGGLGEVYYLDGYGVSIIDMNDTIHCEAMLADLSSITASGDTGTDKKDMQMCKSFEVDLIVTAASGTNETLDVYIYEMDQSYTDVLVGTFAQKLAIGKERIALTHCMGKELYVKYVLGGTNPSFNFEVLIAGKG